LGGIVTAPLGGFLLARGLPRTHVFLSACVFALIAAVATAGDARSQPGKAAALVRLDNPDHATKNAS
jgi:hypothetical protein